MRSDCIEKALKRFFTLYGRFLGRHPVFFIIIPLALAAGLGAGSMYIYTENDAEFLYTPSNGPAKDEKRIVDALFYNRTCRGAPVSRRTCLVESARIIAVSKTPGGILQREPFEQLLRIDEQIRGISVSDGDETITFDDLCARKQNEPCDTMSLFELYGYDSDNLDKINITYPFTMGENRKTYFIGNDISGVTFNGPMVEDATAIQLSFSLKGDMDGLTIDWLDGFLEECDELESELLEFYVYTTHALSKELSKSSRDVIGQFSVAFSMLIGFSIISCFRFDCVQNKPTLAAAGVMSACLAILSAFGLIGLCGVPYIDISSSAPYFIISIGVDDMFIMMSAWKKTSPRKPVDERTSETLSDAALSITITSLTDTLVFVVGAFSPFPSVSYFSILTGAAVIFDYLYQITFFAACMVISGRREAAFRHSILCCIKVKPQENSNCCCYVAIAGSASDDNASNGNLSKSPAPNNGQSDYEPVPMASYNVESNTVEHTADVVVANAESDGVVFVDTPHPLMIFFRDRFSPFICKPRVKAVILTIYLAYIGVAIWGVTCLQEGLAYQEMLPSHSFVTQFLDVESLYFKEFGFPVSVVIYEKVDLSNPTYQEDFNNELKRFEDQKFTLSSEYSMSWLRSYQMFNSLNPPPPQADPMDVLNTFLRQPDFGDFWYDLDFDDDGEYIVASRFYVSTTNIKHTSDEKEMMDTFRMLAETSAHNVTVFTPPFIFYDQYLKVLPTTIRSLGIALLAMMVVSLMLIPVKLCAVWVTVTILSIELGMIGFMAFWGVHLDPVSMIVIIVCIGFSVDFPAHITYLYATSEAETVDEKIQEALFSIGMPVLQGAGSSIIGVLVISSSDVYIFQAFFKTMFLVISLGAIHALFILPVLLSLFSRSTPGASANDKSSGNLQNEGYEPNVGDGGEAATPHKVC